MIDLAGKERRRYVIAAREAGLTLREIAETLGVSRARVQQIYNVAVAERETIRRKRVAPNIDDYPIRKLSHAVMVQFYAECLLRSLRAVRSE